jgi:hypothetical protein
LHLVRRAGDGRNYVRSTSAKTSGRCGLITQEKAVQQIFDAAHQLYNEAWFIQMAPPGHEFHRPADIQRAADSIAKAQSGIAALRRAVRRTARNEMAAS